MLTITDFQLQKLVVKPDQLIKRRGKLGLIKAGTDLAGVKDWLTNKLGKEFKVQYGTFEACHGKTCLWVFRPGPMQTGLYSHRRRIEAWDFRFRK